MSIKLVSQWKPNEDQAKFLAGKKEEFRTVTAYIRYLINEQMKKEARKK